MTHEEFLKRLCQMIHDFCCSEKIDEPPCFCGDNEIAKLEIERGIWRGSSAILNHIENTLKG